jgi:hypothetical protein
MRFDGLRGIVAISGARVEDDGASVGFDARI